uniref:Uncharacterized protein n=1 Tax=Anguilla anguilla TaxID=7936 RepID=A0A0E9RNQ1_ANGAN
MHGNTLKTSQHSGGHGLLADQRGKSQLYTTQVVMLLDIKGDSAWQAQFSVLSAADLRQEAMHCGNTGTVAGQTHV